MKFPIFRINGHELIQYWDYSISDYLKNKDNILPEKNEVKGCYSYKSSKHLRSIVTTWTTAVQLYYLFQKIPINKLYNHITFVTLTLSDKQKDSDLKLKREMLGYFITQLKRKHDVTIYLWIIEKQKNNNSHFHILINQPVPYKLINKYWNDIQKDHDYLINYEKLHPGKQPNSTDIHGLKKINYIELYICKYILKTIAVTELKGRLYGCSDNLRDIKPFTFDSNHVIQEDLYNLSINKDLSSYSSDWFTKIILPDYKKLKEIAPNLFEQLSEYYVAVFKSLYKL